ncbi:MAG: hypothetical protein ABIQ02_16740 [Saprospiraceae bacterium]
MKKSIPALFISIMVVSTYAVSAQSDTLDRESKADSKYTKEAIYLTMTGYVKNNKHYDIGVVGGKLKKELIISPEAIPTFEKYQRQRKWTLLFSGIQLAAEITALITKDKSLRTGLLIGAGATSVVIIPLFLSSNKNLSKAVWIRNGAVLNGQ